MLRSEQSDRRWLAWVFNACGLILLLAFITGCQQQSMANVMVVDPVTGASRAGPTAKRSQPLTIKQCGALYRYDTVPHKAIAYGPNIMEMLLFLGLRDRLIGYTGITADNPIHPELQPLLEGIPELADSGLSMEMILSSGADFVVAGWSYGFHKGAITPALLADYGIGSYVLTESCIRVHQRKRITLYDTLHDLRNLARIFGVQDKVAKRIDRLAKAIERLKQKTQKVDHRPRVFVYDSGIKLPLTAGRFATPHAIIRLAGGRNIMADIHSSWVNTSWETVIERNPQWIVIIDYGSRSAQEKIDFLLSMDILNHVSAIQHHRFVVMTYASATPSPYNIMQAQRLAAAMHPQLDITIQNPMAPILDNKTETATP